MIVSIFFNSPAQLLLSQHMSIVRGANIRDTYQYYGHLLLYNVNPGIQRMIHIATDPQVVKITRVALESFRVTDGTEYDGQMWTFCLVVVKKDSRGAQGLNTPVFVGNGYSILLQSSVGAHYADAQQVIFSAAGIAVNRQPNSRVTWDNPQELLVTLNYQDTIWAVGGCYLAFDTSIVYDIALDILQ